MPPWRSRTGAANLKQAELGRGYGAQELHELITDLARGLVLYPVAHIVEFEPPHETGKAGAHLVHCQWIKLFQAIRLAPNEKGRLRDLRAFESGGQREIRFGGAVPQRYDGRNPAPPMTATAQERDDEDFVQGPVGSIACRPEQNPMPNTKSPE